MPLNLSGLPNVPMRIVTIVVFVLSSWATLSSNWLGESYLLANYFIILLGLWAERDSTSPVPVQCYLFGMVFTILNDILSIGITYSFADDVTKVNSRSRSTFQFNAAMAIILIIIKPIGCIFIFKELQSRSEGGGGDASAPSAYEQLGGNQRSGYQEYGGYSEKAEHPPQYQPPNQPFP